MNKNQNNDYHRVANREKIMTPSESLKLMQEISNKFYETSCMTQCHAFVEFTGLMNEYIKICSEFQKANPDDDFRMLNAHSGKSIKLKRYEIHYIKEKLNCIYQEQIIS
ncbi:MAG: hypothetical protein AV945_gp02 [Phormidium phage MIS-PhV1B]|jgi:hypothetical protein|uniref:hypothetical protein n=1 Tax=Phormidium phage MIS-PhV1B TaxID=1391456 RepID=UPI0003C945F7|nr:MAG: hypothetical protein AV945_gp02 [Phormidium phage MIS-PhV1B]AGZ61809.1 MAG: hypothetical protein [Phormidium phage MIS-PhV1B]